MLNLSYIQLEEIVALLNTAWKVSKYGPEETFHAVEIFYHWNDLISALLFLTLPD